jgi:hypothetical protein
LLARVFRALLRKNAPDCLDAQGLNRSSPGHDRCALQWPASDLAAIITMTAKRFSLPDLRSIAEAVVQADPQNVGGKSEAFGNDRAADIVVEYRMIAEIHVEIFGLSRPILIRTYLKIADCCRSDNNVE